MSDYLTKIVPKDPFCKISEPILEKAKGILESKLSKEIAVWNKTVVQRRFFYR